MKNLLILVLMFCAGAIYSQHKPLDLALLENPLRDFSLPVYQGGIFTLSEQTDKNILLVFPRGYYDKDFWCDICAYQYFEMVNMEEEMKISDQYNLEIVVVLPYNKKIIDKWLLDMPEVYKSLIEPKFKDTTGASEQEIRWINYVKKHYNKDFNYKKGSVPTPFKILIDENHALSERLMLFKTEWWGTTVDQNLPTVILLNKEQTVVYKYISQYTLDRPDMDYLLKIFDTFLKE